MTKRDVIISIQGKQSSFWPNDAGEDETAVELVTSGQLTRKNEEFVLTYKESNMSGLGSTLTTLMVQDRCVTMLRCGPVTTQMVFEQGRNHLSLYETEEGSLMIGVKTKSVSSTLGDHGGEISMEYEVEIDHAVSGLSSVHIHVREAGQGIPPTEMKEDEIVYDRYVN